MRNEMMVGEGRVPPEWEMWRLGDLCNIQLGKMLDAANTIGDQCCYLTNKDVQWDRVFVDDLRTMPMTDEEKVKFSLRKGDLLVCEGGEVGRCAIWNEEIKNCYFQKTLHRVRSKNENVLIFIFRWTLYHSASIGASLTQTL